MSSYMVQGVTDFVHSSHLSVCSSPSFGRISIGDMKLGALIIGIVSLAVVSAEPALRVSGCSSRLFIRVPLHTPSYSFTFRVTGPPTGWI